jgi:hypothetical protein
VGGAVKALGTALKDKLGSAIRILLNVIIPQTQDSPAFVLEEIRTALIIGCRIDMLAAVQLDRQLRLSAGEIDDIRFDHQLAREAWPIMSQAKPQQPLRFR